MPQPKAKGFVLFCGAGACVFMLCAFLLLLRMDLRSVKKIDPRDYTESTDGIAFYHSITVSEQANIIEYSGWVAIEDEAFQQVEHFLALYNTTTSEAYQLPTAMITDESAMQGISDSTSYASGGLYGFVLCEQLSGTLSDYELCIAYRTNGHNFFYHTGIFMTGEVAA